MGLKIVVLYDGWCPFCIKTTNFLKRIDLSRNIEYESFREKSVVDNYKIPATNLEKRMHAIDRNNQAFEGIDAFILISKNILILFPMLPILIISKKLGFGQKLYDFIAGKRVLKLTNCENSCEISHRE